MQKHRGEKGKVDDRRPLCMYDGDAGVLADEVDIPDDLIWCCTIGGNERIEARPEHEFI